MPPSAAKPAVTEPPEVAANERHITVAAETDGDILSLMIQNSFEGHGATSADTILSRKRERCAGVGLETMRSICEKYSGSMKMDWDENTFTVFFVLPLV